MGPMIGEFGLGTSFKKGVNEGKEELEAADAEADLTADERLELARLRAENKRLRMERDILKKATAFFANEKH